MKPVLAIAWYLACGVGWVAAGVAAGILLTVLTYWAGSVPECRDEDN